MKKKEENMNPSGFVFFLLFVQPSTTSSVTGISCEKGRGIRGRDLSGKKNVGKGNDRKRR